MPRGRPWTERDQEIMMQLHAAGKSPERIAKKLGFPPSTIKSKLAPPAPPVSSEDKRELELLEKLARKFGYALAPPRT